MAWAFFDESYHGVAEGYLGVAGFVGSTDQWEILTRGWQEALSSTGARYLHMREFAHSVEAFAEWKGDEDRRRKLLAGAVAALVQSRLTAFGSTLRLRDWSLLNAAQQGRTGHPYLGAFQDVLFGFALTAQGAPVGASVQVIGDRQAEHEHQAQLAYRVLRQRPDYKRLAPQLEFGDARQLVGLQAADLLAYEIVKELQSQDTRRGVPMRWALRQILEDQWSRGLAQIVFRPFDYLLAQAEGYIETDRGRDVVEATVDSMLRIYRVEG